MHKLPTHKFFKSTPRHKLDTISKTITELSKLYSPPRSKLAQTKHAPPNILTFYLPQMYSNQMYPKFASFN